MSLKQKAINGIAWNSLGKIGAGLVNMLITIILARILTPRDFGLLEILIVFSVISEAFVDSGFSQAIIRDKNASNKDLTSIFYTNIIIAFVIYVLLFIFSPFIANFFNEPTLVNLSRVVFLVIIFNSMSIIQEANYSRNINFKSPTLAALSAMFISGLVSIYMAYNGSGIWALAFNLVLFSFFRLIFLWTFSNWRPKGGISLLSIKKYFSFGSNMLIISVVDKIVTNLESVLIGRVYTKTELGFFSQGKKLNSNFTQALSAVVQRVTYPILAKVGDDKQRLKNGYRKIIGYTMLIMIPLSFGIIGSSENLISVLLGSKWLPASKYLQLWTIMGLFLSLHTYYTNIFLVLNRTRFYLNLSLIKQLSKIIIIVFLINSGVMTLLWGIVIISTLTSLLYVFFGGRLINYTFIELFNDLKIIIFSSFVSSSTIHILGLFLKNSNVFLVFTIQIILMVAIYFILLKLFKDKYFNEFFKLIKYSINKNSM